MADINTPSDQNGRRLRPTGIVGTALLVGLLAGGFLAVRDSVRVVVSHPGSGRAMSYGAVLRLFGHAALRYVTTCAGLALLAGGCLAAWAAVRRQRVSVHRAIAGYGAVLGGVVVAAALVPVYEGALGSATAWPVAAGDILALAFACALGVGAALGVIVSVLGARRLVALAAAGLAALFVAGNWGMWLYIVVLPRHGKLVVRAGEAAVVIAAVLAALGAYGLMASRTRRALSGALLLAAVAVGAAAHLGLSTERGAPSTRVRQEVHRPNVVWLVLDGVRADALSCYGNPREATPHLDALAAEGALFERAFSPAPWCLPAHAAMLTGRLPGALRCHAERQFLSDEAVTLAEVLGQNGYRTLAYSSNPYVGARYNLHQGFQRFEAWSRGRTWRGNLLSGRLWRLLERGDQGAREANETAVGWVRQCAAEGQSFFLLINYVEAQNGANAPPIVSGWLPRDSPQADSALTHRELWNRAACGEEIPASQFGLLRALYDGDVAYLDSEIGAFTSALRRLNVMDDTLLIVTADHGTLFGEDGRGGHNASLALPVVRVPLIVRYPPVFTAGARVGSAVSLIDLFPTVLDAADIEWPGAADLPGRSLALTDASPRGVVSECFLPIHVLYHYMGKRLASHTRPYLRRLKSIQTQDEQYVWASDGAEKVFAIGESGEHRRNLAGEMPDTARRLRLRLETRIRESLRAAPADTGRTEP